MRPTGHAIVLDPVGAGASALRTDTAGELLDELPVRVVRGNMSEVKALAGASAATRGVDVNPNDVVTEENLAASAAFARDLAARSGAVVAVTGAIDIVADADRAFAIRNGSPLMGPHHGRRLACSPAWWRRLRRGESPSPLGVPGSRRGGHGTCPASRRRGAWAAWTANGSFRTYLLDALYRLNGDALEAGAKVEELA